MVSEEEIEMTYTTDQVVQMAKEVGAEEDWGSVFQMNRKDLTALCNKVERDTLLKAADRCLVTLDDLDAAIDQAMRKGE